MRRLADIVAWKSAKEMGLRLAAVELQPRAASVLVLASLSVSSPALPRSNFNGDWSVIVQSRCGACAPTVRYPVAITNGVVTNGGENPATVLGRVAPNGKAVVIVQTASSLDGLHSRP